MNKQKRFDAKMNQCKKLGLGLKQKKTYSNWKNKALQLDLFIEVKDELIKENLKLGKI